MATELKSFADSARSFSKSPLGIIALFIVLVYGFASLAATFGTNLEGYLAPLVYFLVAFPVVVFAGFLWLVTQHHDKIYGPSDFKNEDNFMRMKMYSVASLTAATVKMLNNVSGKDVSTEQISSLVEMVSNTDISKISGTHYKSAAKILWVDDRPENNVHERKSFEAEGLEVVISLSTLDAVERIQSTRFSAIISDMGRKEGSQEGYVLLEQVRQLDIQTPFFIYAGSNLPEHRKMALDRGAQGSTNSARELYRLVMSSLEKTK